MPSLIIDCARGHEKDNQQFYPLKWDLKSTQSSLEHFKRNTQEQNVYTRFTYNRERGDTHVGQIKIDCITSEGVINTDHIIM